MPIYVPRELIHAAGMLPLGILGGGDHLEVIHGDAYYQSYICHIPRSTLELGVTGRLDFVDGFLFPSICDVIRNLSGHLEAALPEGVRRATSTCRRTSRTASAASTTCSELQELQEELEELARQARSPTTRCARRSRVYNENRRAGPRALRLPGRGALAGARRPRST